MAGEVLCKQLPSEYAHSAEATVINGSGVLFLPSCVNRAASQSSQQLPWPTDGGPRPWVPSMGRALARAAPRASQALPSSDPGGAARTPTAVLESPRSCPHSPEPPAQGLGVQRHLAGPSVS